MSTNPCEICKNTTSKYCCPRCNILYCSLNCYKSQKHSNCSEEFYKESVIEELKSQANEKGSRGQMLDILKRLEDETDFLDPLDGEEVIEEVDSDDEDDIDLADRLKGVNLDNGDDVWEKLTDSERQQFKNLVDSGDIFGILPVKEPWYISGDSIPKIKSKIPDYSNISSKPPATSVQFNLINILGAYSYMTRYFLSDHQSFPVEVCHCVYVLSSSLTKNIDFDSVDTAIKSLYVEGISKQFEVDKEMHPTVMSDVRRLILGSNGNKIQADDIYILAALSDLIKTFKKVKVLRSSPVSVSQGTFSKQFKETTKLIDIPQSSFTQIFLRLEFFLSYTKSYFRQEVLNLIS